MTRCRRFEASNCLLAEFPAASIQFVIPFFGLGLLWQSMHYKIDFRLTIWTRTNITCIWLCSRIDWLRDLICFLLVQILQLRRCSFMLFPEACNWIHACLLRGVWLIQHCEEDSRWSSSGSKLSERQSLEVLVYLSPGFELSIRAAEWLNKLLTLVCDARSRARRPTPHHSIVELHQQHQVLLMHASKMVSFLSRRQILLLQLSLSLS